MRKAIYLIPCAFSLFLASCATSELDQYEKTASGLMYKFHVKSDDSVDAKYGEMVRLKLTKRLGDSVLESSNMVKPEGYEQFLEKGIFSGSVEEGITLMSIGDSATFLVSTDSINKYYPVRDSSKNFKPGAYIAFDIKLMNIQTEAEAMAALETKRIMYVRERKEREPEEMKRYLEDNHVDVKPTKTGLYFIEKEKGSGPSPKDGDSVLVHYMGSFLNGTIFASSEQGPGPFAFVVNEEGPHGVVPGWNEAIKMMKKGGECTIIIPSALAYDSSGRMDPRSGKYVIPPYAPLKFDIKLLNVSAGKKK